MRGLFCGRLRAWVLGPKRRELANEVPKRGKPFLSAVGGEIGGMINKRVKAAPALADISSSVFAIKRVTIS